MTRLWLVLLVVACATGGTLEPPPKGVRARQTARWLSAIERVIVPGDLVVARRYGTADDAAIEAGASLFTRVGIVDAARGVTDGFGEQVEWLSLEDALMASHQVVVIRPDFVDDERRALAGAAAKARVGQDAMQALLDMRGGVAELGAADGARRSAAFVLAVFASVWPSLAVTFREPKEALEHGQLLFDSGPRR